MANSCSHWWHAPVYFVISATLAVIAITTIMNSRSKSGFPSSDLSIKHDLALKASLALRSHGFNVIATLLRISPELFLSSPECTIFAIQDAAISNVSFPPWVMKQLFQLHTSPSRFPFQRLLEKPLRTCLPTLVHGKSVTITDIDAIRRSLEINNVVVSHPDVFLEGPISIHGVLGPFAELDFQSIDQDWEIIRSPVCDANGVLFSSAGETKNAVEWPRIIQLLSSNGFVSFAMGLHSVLHRIVGDKDSDLSSVTIFAPRDLPCVNSPLPYLERVVRFHIHPGNLSYLKLISLPKKSLLETLVPNESLRVSAEGADGGRILVINGAEVTAPDIFFSKNFRIHAISRALDSDNLSCVSIRRYSD